MAVYPALATATAILVVLAELLWFKSGIFRTGSYYLSMLIILGFMILVDGWLTKLSAPIVIYDDEQTSAIRPIWDILVEEYVYAFALLTMVMLLWDRAGKRETK